MKLLTMALLGVLAACSNSPPVDNPSSPGSFRPASEEHGEARALEVAEADCVKQGKHAQASRVEGDTVYTCK
jgi:hypothetical protein